MSILSTNTTLARKLLLLVCCALCLLATPLHAAAFQQESHTTSTSSSTGSGLAGEVDQQECSTTEDNQTLAEKEREALIIDKYLDDFNKIAERYFRIINTAKERKEQRDKRSALKEIKVEETAKKLKEIEKKQGKKLTTAEIMQIVQKELPGLAPDAISTCHEVYKVKGKGKRWREKASKEEYKRITERVSNAFFIANEYNLFGELCYCLNMETLIHVMNSLLALKRGELSINAFLETLLDTMRIIMENSNHNILYLNYCFFPETKVLQRQYLSEISPKHKGIRHLVESLYDNKSKEGFDIATIYLLLEILAKNVVVCFIQKEGIPLSDTNKRTLANMPTLLKRVQGIDLDNPLAWAAGHILLQKLSKKVPIPVGRETFKLHLNHKIISPTHPLYAIFNDCDLLRLVHNSPTFYHISVPIPGVGVANYVDSVAPDQGVLTAEREVNSFPPLDLNDYLPPQSSQPQASSSAPKQRSISKKAAQHNTKNKRPPIVEGEIREQQKDKDKKIVPPTGTGEEEDKSNKKRKDQRTPPPIIRRQEEQEDYKGQTTTSTKGLEKEAAGEAPSIEEPHSPTTDDTVALQDLLNKDSLKHKSAVTETALNQVYDRFTEGCRSSVTLQHEKGGKLIITPLKGIRHAFHAWFNEIPPSKSLNRRNQEVVDRVFDKKRSKDIPKRALLRVWNDLGGSYSEIGSRIKIKDSEGGYLCFIYTPKKGEKESGFSQESISKMRTVFLMQGAMPTGYHLVN